MDNEIMVIPTVVMESVVNRFERVIKYVIIGWVISTLIVSCAFGFIWYTSGSEYIETYEETHEITSDNGNANYIGNSGEINN